VCIQGYMCIQGVHVYTGVYMVYTRGILGYIVSSSGKF
jgi:hypothetical protein